MVPQAATAATTIGQTFTPTQGCSPTTFLQTAPTYTIPSNGVVTSWSFQADGSPPQLRFKVAENTSGTNYKTVGLDTILRSPEPNKLNTYKVRIPVKAKQVIGFWTGTGNCAAATAISSVFLPITDPPLNETNFYTAYGSSQFDVSATLEADADADGFGDETQDACPADSARQAPPCATTTPTPSADKTPPETTITKKPAAKTKKKKATFEFTSNEAGSSFQCQLDGKGFKPCSSPLTTAKLKKGKHSFEVKATDAAGNVDASAASASWKIIKKKAPKKAHHK